MSTNEASNTMVSATIGRFLLITVSLFCLAFAGQAQVSSNIKLAYNASILYPGFRGGVEHPLRIENWTKYRHNGSEKHFTRTRLWSLELGYYHHPTFHDNLYLLGGWIMRKVHPHGFFTEFSPALGYSRTFLGGTTYTVDDFTGEVHRLRAAGYNYAMLSIGGGLGFKLKSQFSAYFRPSLLLMYPSNNIVYLRPTVELGVLYTPNGFWTAHPKIVQKTRGKGH